MATGRPKPAPRRRPTADQRRWLLVQNLPDDVSSDTLMFYFESKRQFGRELSVENVELNTAEDWAVITFDNASDARTVINTHNQSPCQVEGQTLDVKIFDGDIKSIVSKNEPEKKLEQQRSKSRINCEAIEVRGFCDISTEQSLQYYFENARRSGGGPVNICRLDKENGCLLLQFEDQSVVDAVLQREHVVENCPLILLKIEMNTKQLVFSDFSENTSEDLLINFLESRLAVPVDAMFMYWEINKALIQFSKEIDFNEACRLCKMEKINGVHITPHHVPVTNTIKVTNVLDVAPDYVERYFENKHVSNGGEIQKVKFYADQGYCLLSFKDANVVQNVCGKKDHKIKGEKVNVEPYLEILQPTQSEVIKLPDPIVLKNDDPNKVEFVKRQPSELKEMMGKCHARINLDCSPLMVECSLDISDVSNRKRLSTWGKDTQSVIDEYFNGLVVKTRNVESSLWGSVVDALSCIVIPDTVTKTVATFLKTESCCITVVAPNINFDTAWNIIHNTIEKAEEQYHQEKTIVTEEKVLSAWKIRYIETVGLVKEITKTYERLDIDLSDKDGKVVFTGPRHSVTNAVKDLLKRLRNVVHREIKLKPQIAQLVQNSQVQDYIKDTFKDQYLPQSYVICDRYITLFARDEDDLDQMITAFWDMLSTVEIPLDERKAELLKSPGWEKLSKSLSRKHGGCMVMTTRRELVEVCTTSDLRDEIVDELQEFLSENAVYKKQIKMSPHIIKYIQKVARKRYDQEIQMGHYKAITLDEDRGAITIQGTTDALKEGVEIIQKFEKSITVHKHTIRHEKIKEYFLSSKGKECLLKVQETIPCVLHIEDIGSTGANLSVERYDKLVCCAEADHTSGVKIQVFGGDILSLNGDVLVNAANKHLEHNGGLANIIAKKGGRQIVEECKDHIGANGPLSDGDVFVSTAGRLQSKMVVHAVGPRWSGGSRGEADSLKKAITECLKTASGKNMKTIAIPALCTGKFGYPAKLACLAIVEAVDVYLKEQGGSIKKVLFCDINVSTVQAFTNALKTIFQGVQMHVKQARDDANKFRDCCTFGNVQVSVVNGLLTKEKVDVIVNNTAKRLKLDRGRSSAAILGSAGNIIQQECQQKYPDGIDYGQVAITSGGKLNCSNIFHVAIDKYDSNNSTACFQQMDQCVTSCLQEASKLGLKSISFPAMGTGLQKYPKKEVAKQIMKSTHTFCQNVTGTSLNTVHFVIYTGEDNTYDIFQTELVKYAPKDSSGKQNMDTSNPDDGDFCHVTIYADNRHDAGKAARKLDETVKKEWQIKKIEDGNIHKLSTNDITKLKATATSKGVDIVVDTDIGSIQIVGLDVDVLEISHRITERLRSIEKWDGKKEKARLMAATVQWCYVKNQQECPLPGVTNLDVENAYQQKLKTIKVKDGKKVEYEITFASMTEVEVNNPGNTFQVKRNDLLKTAVSVGVPNFWQSMAATERLAMVTLAPGSSEYQQVVGDFQRTLGRIPTIAKVERVQNKILYTQYQTKRTQFDQTTPNFERVLWHGTAEATIPIVNLNGFNRSYSNSGLKGVYFAVNASYSDNNRYARVCSDGYKRMYRCLVLTGKVSTASGALGPPPINPAVPHVLHDSVADNPANPVMFIIFNDTQAYPGHLIAYK